MAKYAGLKEVAAATVYGDNVTGWVIDQVSRHGSVSAAARANGVSNATFFYYLKKAGVYIKKQTSVIAVPKETARPKHVVQEYVLRTEDEPRPGFWAAGVWIEGANNG